MGNSPADRRDSPALPARRLGAPLREQVSEALRQAIQNFHYKPGQRLIERELIAEIGVSRTTIREALRELAAEGLVQTIPQRGAIVVAPSAQEVTELYELRTVLETLAVRRFVERAGDEQVRDLRAALTRLHDTVHDDRSIRQVMRATDDFYDVLLTGCGNRSVQASLASLRARLSLVRAASLSDPDRSAAAVAELVTVVEAIERRSADAAAAACTVHLDRAMRAGLDSLAGVENRPPSS